MTTQERRTRRRYMPGLDGLRAIAVLVVIAYHLNVPFLTGGFLGVDFFFVISGFLITDLLIAEWREHGRIDLKQFWVRRARRLLPALWLVLLAVAALSAAITLAGGQIAAGLRGNVIAALTYVSNWWQILENTAYTAKFDGAAPPLMHLWSLAVEEQFYLLWPLLLLVFLRLLRHRAIIAPLVIALAATSVAWMWVLFHPGDDSSRAYYGTDTHAFGLLIGAFLAVAVGSERLRRVTAWTSLSLQALGLLALAGFGVLVVVLRDDATASFRGGIALASVAAALVIAGVVVPGVLGRGLSVGPLRWLGVRSYGLYLWHWPTIAFVDLARTSLLPEPVAELLPVRILAGIVVVTVSITLAAFSWRFVERPVQQLGIIGGLGALYRGLVARSATIGHRLAPIGLTGITALAVAGCVLAPQTSQLQQQLDAGREAMRNAAAHPPTPGQRPRPAKPTPVKVSGDRMTAIGDSVMLASAQALYDRFPGIYVDADDSRSMLVAPELMADLDGQDLLRDFVAIGTADNGGVHRSTIERLVDGVGKHRLLILVNTPVEASWSEAANDLLDEVAGEHDNVRVADWKSWAEDNTGELLDDGVHPATSAARKAYAEAIATAAKDPPLAVGNGPTPNAGGSGDEDYSADDPGADTEDGDDSDAGEDDGSTPDSSGDAGDGGDSDDPGGSGESGGPGDGGDGSDGGTGSDNGDGSPSPTDDPTDDGSGDGGSDDGGSDDGSPGEGGDDGGSDDETGDPGDPGDGDTTESPGDGGSPTGQP